MDSVLLAYTGPGVFFAMYQLVPLLSIAGYGI